MVCERAASPGRFRVWPVVGVRAGVPVPGVVFLVQQEDNGHWREVARFADAGDANAEADRLRRIRAAIRSGDPR